MLLPLGVLIIGGGMFACFLSFYILSFAAYNDGWGTSVSFNEDYLVFALLGFFLLCLGLGLLISFLKGKQSKALLPLGLFAIGCIALIYASFMVIKSYAKGLGELPFYWATLFVSLLLCLLSGCALLTKKK
jgi:hypothetical protein